MSAHKDKHVELVPDPPPSADPAAAAAADPAPAGDGSDAYQKLLAEKQELMNTLLRRQADFDNYRKRVEKERLQERQRGVELLIEQLLPVLDAFDLALEGVDEASSDKAGAEYRKGFELIRRRLSDALTKQGLVRIESVGKEFDPNFHHAIDRVETAEHADGTVVVELQPGYLFQDRVLRPAMVRVASAPGGAPHRAQRHGN